MKKAGNRKQGTGISGPRLARQWLESGKRLHIVEAPCCTPECNEAVTVIYGGRGYCLKCYADVESLDRLHEGRGCEQASAPALFVERLKLGRWLNYTTIAVLAGVGFEVGMRVGLWVMAAFDPGAAWGPWGQ